MLRGVKNLSGLAGPNASLKNAGRASGGVGSALPQVMSWRRGGSISIPQMAPQVGDSLFVVTAESTPPTPSAPSGLTEIAYFSIGGGDDLKIFSKTIVGDETVVTNINDNCICFLVRGGTNFQTPEVLSISGSNGVDTGSYVIPDLTSYDYYLHVEALRVLTPAGDSDNLLSISGTFGPPANTLHDSAGVHIRPGSDSNRTIQWAVGDWYSASFGNNATTSKPFIIGFDA